MSIFKAFSPKAKSGVTCFFIGTKDIEIKRPSVFFGYPGGHAQYWEYENKQNILDEIWEVLENKQNAVK